MTEINIERLTEIEELRAILTLYKEAKEYLEAFKWCISTKKSWYDKDCGIYEKVGVFLFEIEPADNYVDDFIWVIVGDIPSVYLDKSIKTGKEALNTYCELMQEWIDNVKAQKSLDECFPIGVDATHENADLLNSRITFIKRELLMTDSK
jgi:hypothetical protein